MSAAQVGRRVARSDARAKIRGTAQYAGDLRLPGMLHGKVLRSPHPHARIGAIDTTAAVAMPGVVAVITSADLADLDACYGHLIRDRPVLATQVARFAGEPVAAVAAETERQADAALLAIAVDYEPLPVLADVDAATATGAVELHAGPQRRGTFFGYGELPPRAGNTCYRATVVRGDVAAAFAAADVVVEGEYRFPSVYQYALEPHTVVASYADDEIAVWASCQHPYLVRVELAEIFGRPPDEVRVVVPYLGGGFGSKSYTKIEPLAVALARAAGRPVRLANRVDEAIATTRRHAMRCRMRTAARADGTLLAREVHAELDTGAYADNGPTVAYMAALVGGGPYRWEAVDVAADCVYTNRSPAGSYRGFGAAHLGWIGESQVDEVAGRLGLDRLELRLHNLLERGEEVIAGMRPLDADLRADLRAAADAIGWGGPLDADEGRGLGVAVLPAGASPASNALVRVAGDGRVAVIVGTTEVGQGARTIHGQIAAEVLGVAAEGVTVHGTDTRFTPFDRSTGASRSTTLAGLAVQRAARDARDQLAGAAAEAWGVPLDQVATRDGLLAAAGRTMTFAEAVRRRTGVPVGAELVGHGSVGQGGELAQAPQFWEIGAAAAHVALDRSTGQVRVRATATVADVGKAINPQLVERQDEGCTLQAIGNTLFEELRWNEDGILENDTLLDYRVPTTADVPDSMTCVIVERGDGPGPFGAKGCGEGVFGALPGALVNAIAEAGVAVRELPATPERIARLLDEAP